MDEHLGPTSPDQSAPPPVSYSRDQKPTWNVFGKFIDLFSNRTTALAGVLVLVLGVGAAIVAVQRSTETRQHAAAIIPPGGPCYPAGDVNVDGKVGALDALLIQRYVGGLSITGNFNQKNADVDADGKITSADSLRIQKYIAGLDTTNFASCKAPTPTPTLATSISSRGPCYPIGDTNLDGKVDNVDALLILRYVALLPITGTFNQKYADVDRNSKIDSVDALKIQRYITGLEKTFPACGATTPTPTKAPYPTPTPRPTIGPYPTPTPVPPMISPWSATPIPTK